MNMFYAMNIFNFKNILFMKETIKYIISKSIYHRVETVTILPKRDSKYLYYVDFFETQSLSLMKNIYPKFLRLEKVATHKPGGYIYKCPHSQLLLVVDHYNLLEVNLLSSMF